MDSFLTLRDGRKLSYRRVSGKKPVEIVFMHGTLSDKNASKSLFLQEYCQKNDFSFTAFDFIGHGQSSGKYTDGTIGLWRDNALDIIDGVTQSPLILVGSSMGGWISLLAARARPERVKAVVGLAAAADFTVAVWESFTDRQRRDILENGIIHTPNGWTEEGDPWTRDLFEDGKKHLVLNGTDSLDITCPMTLIHGAKDDCVPVETAFKICDAAKSENIKIVVLKNSGHRLSEPHELAVLENELNFLV